MPPSRRPDYTAQRGRRPIARGFSAHDPSSLFLQADPRLSSSVEPESAMPKGSSGSDARGVAPLVPVMDSTDTAQSDDLGRGGRPVRRLSWDRSVLVQRQVAAIVVVVGDVLRQQLTEMGLVEDYDMGEELPANGKDPALRYSVLPRRSPRCAHQFHAPGPQLLRYHRAVLPVPVEDEVSGIGGLLARRGRRDAPVFVSTVCPPTQLNCGHERRTSSTVS